MTPHEVTDTSITDLAARYADLAAEIHQTARDKGFWDEERDLEEMLMLAVSELSEGLEEHRDGHPLIWLAHKDSCPEQLGKLVTDHECGSCTPKPEGLAVEVADCMIRCLDTLQHKAGANLTHLLSVSFKTWINRMPSRRSGQLFHMVRLVANAAPDAFVKPYLAQTVVTGDWMLHDLGFDPFAVIKLKMDYNSTRPYKHGKAY